VAAACVIAALVSGHTAFAQEDEFLSIDTTSGEIPNVQPGDPPIMEGSAQSLLLLDEGEDTSRRRSPWSVSLFNWSNINMRDQSNGEGRLSSYNYLSFNYRYSYEFRLSIRPEFYISGAGNDIYGKYAEAEQELGDIYVQGFHNRLALLGDAVGLKGGFRVYYPNSKNSKLQKQIGRIQGRLIFEIPLGNGTWIIHRVNPMYYVQSQKSYLSEFLQARANPEFEVENLLEISKFFNNKFGVHQNFKAEHRWYHKSETNGLDESNRLTTSMGTWLSYSMYGANFKGGLVYEVLHDGRPRNRKFYNAEDTAYSLMTYLRF